MSAKKEELRHSEELPTKSDFEEWSKKFNLLDPRRALSDEEQFLRQFVPGGKGDSAFMILVATSIMTIWLFYQLYETFTEDEWELKDDMFLMPWINLVICRTILAWYLHMIIDKDIKQGHRFMKYGLNHPWKFRAFCTTYFIGALQSGVALFAEFISIAVLLGTRSYIDAVKDFIALVVVNDFDNMIFGYLQDDNLAKLVVSGEVKVGSIKLKTSDLLKIETSSAFKPEDEFGNE